MTGVEKKAAIVVNTELVEVVSSAEYSRGAGTQKGDREDNDVCVI